MEHKNSNVNTFLTVIRSGKPVLWYSHDCRSLSWYPVPTYPTWRVYSRKGVDEDDSINYFMLVNTSNRIVGGSRDLASKVGTYILPVHRYLGNPILFTYRYCGHYMVLGIAWCHFWHSHTSVFRLKGNLKLDPPCEFWLRRYKKQK